MAVGSGSLRRLSCVERGEVERLWARMRAVRRWWWRGGGERRAGIGRCAGFFGRAAGLLGIAGASGGAAVGAGDVVGDGGE